MPASTKTTHQKKEDRYAVQERWVAIGSGACHTVGQAAQTTRPLHYTRLVP